MKLPRVRLTVRQMMLVVAATAVLLGWAAWYADLARRQQRVVVFVKSHSGVVYYDYQAEALERKVTEKPWAPSWLSRALG